jgi:hypothetical protein
MLVPSRALRDFFAEGSRHFQAVRRADAEHAALFHEETAMKTTFTALTLAALLLGSNSFAGESQECSARQLAGRWMFATDVGRQLYFPGGDITAIGTFRVDRSGNLRGVFDATVAGWMFLPGVTFTGAFAVNPDCTGTLTFTTATGSSRTDTIVILGDTIRGMSQDTTFLWTYEAKRMKDPR